MRRHLLKSDNPLEFFKDADYPCIIVSRSETAGVGLVIIWLAVILLNLFTQSASAETYTIDVKQSEAVFLITHEIGFNTAFVQQLSGTFDIDDKSGAVNALEAEFDIASLTSFNEKRDKLLQSEDFFNTAKFPKASLKLKMADDKTLQADVTIRGVTKSVEFEYFYFGKSQDAAGKPTALIRLSGTLKRSDFGMTHNVTSQDGTNLLGEEVDVLVDLLGNLP